MRLALARKRPEEDVPMPTQYTHKAAEALQQAQKLATWNEAAEVLGHQLERLLAA